jgi:hypothetical protein
MKNSKTTTYILLTVVFVIWGGVFYRVFSGLDSTNTGQPLKVLPVAPETNRVEEEETFLLRADYRDPFLSGTQQLFASGNNNTAPEVAMAKIGGGKKEKKEASKTVSNLPIVAEVAAPTDFSFIKYIGIINNKQTNKKVGVLSVRGKEYMVSDGDIVSDVTVLRKERDSVEVSYKNEKRWIKR